MGIPGRSTKPAIELQSGDVCDGPVPFVDRGIVKTTVVVDAGVQVFWVGGTHTTRPEGYFFDVVSKPGPSFTAR